MKQAFAPEDTWRPWILSKKLAIFLATSGHSGVDRIMTNFIRELSRRGLPVDLVQIRNHGPYLPKALPNVRLIPLPVSHVNSALPSLIRYLRKERPSAILTDKDRVNRIAIIARLLAGTSTRVAVRIGTTVSRNLERRSWLHRKMQYASIRYLYPQANCVIVPSFGVAQDLNQISGLPFNHIKVLPNPIVSSEIQNLSKTSTGDPWLRENSLPIIIGIGELCARKDFGTLIRAFSQLLPKKPSRLLILGEGRQRQKLQGLIKELGLIDKVRMPGFVKNPFPYIKRASVLALSSTCEGLGVVLIEALALGTPVVSTDCPSGPREILRNGEVGPLVPIGDANAMAKAILSVLEAPPDPKLLKEAALPYSVKQATDQYLKVLGLSDVANTV